MMQKPPRPIGITLLAVIQILIGVLGFLVSLAIIGVAALFSTVPTIGTLIGSVGVVIGGVFAFFSLIWLATGVGFLHGKGWAWTLGMIFTIISILGAAYHDHLSHQISRQGLLRQGNSLNLYASDEHATDIEIRSNSPIADSVCSGSPANSSVHPCQSSANTSTGTGDRSREVSFLRRPAGSGQLVLY